MVPSSYSRLSTFSPEVSSSVTSTTTTVSSSSSSSSSMGIGYSQSLITSVPSYISFISSQSQPVNSSMYSLHPTPLAVSSTPGGILEVQQTQQQILQQQMQQAPLPHMQQGPAYQQPQPLQQRREVPVQQVPSLHDVSRLQAPYFQQLPSAASHGGYQQHRQDDAGALWRVPPSHHGSSGVQPRVDSQDFQVQHVSGLQPLRGPQDSKSSKKNTGSDSLNSLYNITIKNPQYRASDFGRLSNFPYAKDITEGNSNLAIFSYTL